MRLGKSRKTQQAERFIPTSVVRGLADVMATEGDLPDSAQSEFTAWLMGAHLSAELCLNTLPELRELWEGTAEDMSGVLKVYSLAMVSRWGRHAWARRYAPEQVSSMVRGGAAAIFTLFGSGEQTGDEALAEFAAVNAQFNQDMAFHEQPNHQGSRWETEAELMLSLAARELGRPLPVAVTSLGLPVDDLLGLLSAGWKPFLREFSSAMLAPSLLMDGATHMMQSWQSVARPVATA